MSEIMDQLIEDSKIKSLALMLQDGISEEKACWYLQIPPERRKEMLGGAKTIQFSSNKLQILQEGDKELLQATIGRESIIKK